jgi:hypothetical protein
MIGDVLVNAEIRPWRPSVGGVSAQWKLCATGFLACLLLGVPPAQAASEVFVNLSYQVDPALSGCPDEDEFRSIVVRQIGYDPYRPSSSLGVEVRVKSTERGLEGVIVWNASAQKRVGERRFASGGRDCQELVSAMGFVLGVQIELMARAPATAASPVSADTEAPDGFDSSRNPIAQVGDKPSDAAAPSQDQVSQALPPSTPESEPWSGMVGLGPSVGLGLGPKLLAQGRLFFFVQHGQAAFELAAEASLPTTTRQPYGGGFRHELVLGVAAVCGLHRSISACAIAKLGRILVHGVGLDKPASASGSIGMVGPRLGYSLRLGDHLVLLGHVEGLYLMTSWTVEVNDVAVWTMPRFGAVAGIDLAAHF